MGNFEARQQPLGASNRGSTDVGRVPCDRVHQNRNLQVPVQSTHPSQRSATRKDEGQVKQAFKKGLQSLHQRQKLIFQRKSSPNPPQTNSTDLWKSSLHLTYFAKNNFLSNFVKLSLEW